MKQFSKFVTLSMAAFAVAVIARAEDPKPTTAAAPTSAAAGEKKPVVQTAPAKITWLDYDDGLAKAKSENKPIMVDFTATWCGWCKKMDATTFADPEIIEYVNTKMVAVKVWGDDTTKAGMVSLEGEKITQKALTAQFAIRGFPAIWFLDSAGGKLGPARPGYVTKDVLLPLVEFVGGGHYKTTSYENFIKKRS